jgi:hypothetical protein
MVDSRIGAMRWWDSLRSAAVAWYLDGSGRLAAVGDAVLFAVLRLTAVRVGSVQADEPHQRSTGVQLADRQAAQGVIEWIVMVAIVVAIAFAAIKVLGPVVSQKVTDIAACFGAAGKGPFGAGTCTLGS